MPVSNCLMKISKEDVFTQFLHACVDDLINRRTITYNHFSNEIEWTKDDYNTALNVCKNLFIKLGHGVDVNSLEEYKNLDLYRQDIVNKCFKLREYEIINSLLTLRYSENECLMTDFDWRLKLVMGSAKYTNFTEPLVQLDLHTLDKSIPKVISIEMNNIELRKLIDVLEEANKE